MYDYIRGAVDRLTPAEAVIEAGGVGYSLNISLQTYASIGSSETVKLYTHFIVREDAQILYGFYSLAEREVFRALIGVSGVGGNTARMILSTFSSDEVRTIISTGQADVLKSVKGLGIKTAQKIIVELRDKLGVLPGGDAQLPMQAGGRRIVCRSAFGADDARICQTGLRKGAARTGQRTAPGAGRRADPHGA